MFKYFPDTASFFEHRLKKFKKKESDVKFKFLPEMFQERGSAIQMLLGAQKAITVDSAVVLAQAALDAHLATLPTVWQTKTDLTNPGGHKLLSEWIEIDKWPGATHQAVLMNVEPIGKVKCEHVPEAVLTCETKTGVQIGEYACKHCGIKLKQKWEAAE